MTDIPSSSICQKPVANELPGKGLGKSMHRFRLRSEQNVAGTERPTEGESSGILASRSSASWARPASAEEDEGAESAPSHPSQIDGDGDADVDDEGRSRRVLLVRGLPAALTAAPA